MFSSWDGFASRLMQIFGNLKATMIAEQKLSKLTQKGSVTDYTMMFQMYLIQVKWNQEAFMAKYKQGLKSRVQDILIYI